MNIFVSDQSRCCSKCHSLEILEDDNNPTFSDRTELLFFTRVPFFSHYQLIHFYSLFVILKAFQVQLVPFSNYHFSNPIQSSNPHCGRYTYLNGMFQHTSRRVQWRLTFRTLPFSSLERSVAPLGLFRVLHSKECANVTLYIRRSYRSEITNIWRSFLSHGVIYLSVLSFFFTQFAKYLFISFIDRPKIVAFHPQQVFIVFNLACRFET